MGGWGGVRWWTGRLGEVERSENKEQGGCCFYLFLSISLPIIGGGGGGGSDGIIDIRPGSG